MKRLIKKAANWYDKRKEYDPEDWNKFKKYLEDRGMTFYSNLGHEAHNRDWVIVYKNGHFFMSYAHHAAINQMSDELKNEPEEEMAFASVVDTKDDVTGKTKCIYITTLKHGFKGNLQEVAQKFKDKFPEYEIYDDDSGRINVEEMKIEYDQLVK